MYHLENVIFDKILCTFTKMYLFKQKFSKRNKYKEN